MRAVHAVVANVLALARSKGPDRAGRERVLANLGLVRRRVRGGHDDEFALVVVRELDRAAVNRDDVLAVHERHTDDVEALLECGAVGKRQWEKLRNTRYLCGNA